MRFGKLKKLVVRITLMFFVFAFVSCSRNKDATIKADLTTKATTEKDFSGVRFTVEDGVVTLSGVCATDKARNSVYEKVKGLYAVKDVVNNLSIGPVVIGTDELLKQGVDSVLKKYAGVQAIVRDSVVELEGKATSHESEKLIAAIEKLAPERVENKLMVR